MSGPYGL
jgi:hypothetical protein